MVDSTRPDSTLSSHPPIERLNNYLIQSFRGTGNCSNIIGQIYINRQGYIVTDMLKNRKNHIHRKLALTSL